MIVSTFIQEVSRVLKKNCLFKFQVRGKNAANLLDDKWQNVRFSSEEIFVLAQNNNFEVIDTNGENTENYWITLQLNWNGVLLWGFGETMIILGISHPIASTNAAALVRDGEILSSVEEEQLEERIKNKKQAIEFVKKQFLEKY